MGIYYNFIDSFMKGEHDLVDDTLKAVLLTSSYTPDYTNHTTYSDISAYEVSGSGYTAGGGTLSGQSWSQSGTAFMLDVSDTGWTSFTQTCRYVAIYNDTHASDELIALVDFGENVTPTGDAFVVTWHSYGIIRVGIPTNCYASLIDYLGRGEVNLNSTVMKAALFTDLFSFDSSDESYGDLSNEITGTGYTTGGAIAENNSVTQSGATATFDCDNVTWTDLDVTSNGAQFVVLYFSGHADDILVCCQELETTWDPQGDSFTVQINSNGVFGLTTV